MKVWLPPIATNPVTGAPIARCDIGFHAYDRLDPRLFCLFLELPRRVKVTVIRYREGRLLEFEGSTDEVFDPVCAVEEGVF